MKRPELLILAAVIFVMFVMPRSKQSAAFNPIGGVAGAGADLATDFIGGTGAVGDALSSITQSLNNAVAALTSPAASSSPMPSPAASSLPSASSLPAATSPLAAPSPSVLMAPQPVFTIAGGEASPSVTFGAPEQGGGM